MEKNEYFCDECEAIIEGKPFTVENTNGKFCDWFCAAHQHSIEMNVTIKPLYVRDDHENG